MLYYLFYNILREVHPSMSWLRVFYFVSFRTAIAALTALLISLLVGPYMIARLKEFQIGQQIREEGPRSHQAKRGTPTMGGVLIIASVVVSTLLWLNNSRLMPRGLQNGRTVNLSLAGALVLYAYLAVRSVL